MPIRQYLKTQNTKTYTKNQLDTSHLRAEQTRILTHQPITQAYIPRLARASRKNHTPGQHQ